MIGLDADRCSSCYLRLTWVDPALVGPPLCDDCMRARDHVPTKGCQDCGLPHNPLRRRCSDVQARIDGVVVGHPEGVGGWATPVPRLPVTTAGYRDNDDEWAAS